MVSTRRRRTAGFTLIELLIVVAIIGVVASILIPNLLDALQKAKQRATVGDIRSVGSAWMSWLTDEISAAAAGSSRVFDFDQLTVPLTAEELNQILFTSPKQFYLRNVPPRDGWSHEFTFVWAGDPLAEVVLGIRSLGRDGAVGPTANPYPLQPFIASHYDEDIVWSDGLFIRFPAGAKSR